MSRQCKLLNHLIDLRSKNQPPQYVFKDVAEWSESTIVDHRPDLGLYGMDAASQEAFERDPEAPSHVDPLRRPYMARVAYAWLKLFVEVG